MMMNFKKNQNNAVCSMDCKNCPNGASQPNPMDDSMFEKSIAMLHNWVMLEAIREDHPKERIVMVILPGAGGELLTEAGSRDIFEMFTMRWRLIWWQMGNCFSIMTRAM